MPGKVYVIWAAVQQDGIKDKTALYALYLRSDRWDIKRRCVLSRANYRCEQCGRQGWLEIHYKTYDHIFEETIDDLLALCNDCHGEAHVKRGRSQVGDTLAAYAEKKCDPERRYVEDEADPVTRPIATSIMRPGTFAGL